MKEYISMIYLSYFSYLFNRDPRNNDLFWEKRINFSVSTQDVKVRFYGNCTTQIYLSAFLFLFSRYRKSCEFTKWAFERVIPEENKRSRSRCMVLLSYHSW